MLSSDSWQWTLYRNGRAIPGKGLTEAELKENVEWFRSWAGQQLQRPAKAEGNFLPAAGKVEATL
jgi:hypothetical protein